MGNNYETDDDDFYSEDNLSKVNDIDLSEEVSSEPIITDNTLEEEPQPKTYSLKVEGMEDMEMEEEPQPKTYSLKIEGMEDMSVEDDNDDILSPEERLNMFADSILSCCIGEKGIRNYALDKLLTFAKPQVFRNENFVIFTVLFNYRSKLKRINIDEEFLKLFLNRNRGILQKSRSYIDINAYGEIDGSVELGYISGVLKHFKRLASMEEISVPEFETCFEKYLIEFKAIETEKAYNQASIILTEGLTLGRKKYFGFEDSTNFLNRKIAEIKGLVDMQEGTGFTTAREMLNEEKETVKSEKVADWGRLKTLNDVYGGIYTGMFYQFIAPPKTGKSKLCAKETHIAAIEWGTNVSVWAIEGGKEAFLAQLRAIHFDYIYNRNVGITEKKFGVSQDVILHDKFPNDELKQLELSSKLDLASNEDYGSIDFIDRPFNVETFLEDIDTSIKSNNSRMLVIDYLQLIGSSTNIDERKAVADAYKKLLKYCKTNNIAVVSPGQYKQEAMDKLINMKDTSQAEMRTAGGSSSEVIRTPDVIFALWATTQDITNNTIKIISMPGRFSKPFPQIDVITDFESCQFIEVEK